MTLENIKNHLKKLREKMEKIREEEKKWMVMERNAEDAAKLKIIRKSNLTIEQLKYLNGINEEEIALIKRRREEGTDGILKKSQTSEKD
ncbi:MAG: hypothetical protein K6A90_03365 [Lachnospiraceae bacterium]|nr:hypothetical protein [Lachnospiraceae bacterium]